MDFFIRKIGKIHDHFFAIGNEADFQPKLKENGWGPVNIFIFRYLRNILIVPLVSKKEPILI